MRRTLLGCCEDCKHSSDLSNNCNNNHNALSCRGCRLHTKPLPMGGREVEPAIPEYGPVISTLVTCRCLQDATEQEVKTGVCKYRRSK